MRGHAKQYGVSSCVGEDWDEEGEDTDLLPHEKNRISYIVLEYNVDELDVYVLRRRNTWRRMLREPIWEF